MTDDRHPDHDAVDRILEQWAAERPDLDASPIGVIGRLHRVGDHLRRALLEVFAEHGLGEGDFDVLATLRRHGAPYAMQPRELADQTMVTTGDITKRIDRLVAAGLVTREAGTGDARTRLVTLTDHGRSAIDDALAAHLRNEHALEEDDRAQLASILRRWHLALEG